MIAATSSAPGRIVASRFAKVFRTDREDGGAFGLFTILMTVLPPRDLQTGQLNNQVLFRIATTLLLITWKRCTRC
jgi:hypothetical protein